jgi:exopolysaccharide biosynthesis WecB/TagA/CpsF family protein
MSDAAMVSSRSSRAVDPGAFALHTVTALGLPLVTGTFEEVTTLLEAATREPFAEPLIAAHINLANLHTLSRNPQLAEALQRNALLFLDGIGLKVGVAIMRGGWVNDVNGTDLFPLMMERLAVRGGRVYFVGSTPAVADDAARVVSSRYDGLEVVGWEHGFFSREDEDAVVQRIRDAHPDVLLVGRGFGLQEEFVLRHRHALPVPLIWTVGGLFDMISEHVPRAPRWMRRLRLEWLFRFAREPGRMWRRNIISPAWFFARVMAARCRRRGVGP